MKKIACSLLGFVLCFMQPLSAALIEGQTIVVDGIELDLNRYNWSTKTYYAGFWSTSVGFFHIQRYDGSIDIYGSNRNIRDLDVDNFYESLYPLEDNLLPYATPFWKNEADYELMSESNVVLDNRPAKKLVFEVTYPSNHSEIIITYLFTVEKPGYLYNSFLGHTISFSCQKIKYPKVRYMIDAIANEMKIPQS